MSIRKPIDWKETVTGCWECISHGLYKGYPSCVRQSYHYRLNRFMYEQCFGEIPVGMVVRHKCDNRACINPEHLELGTARDNARDKLRHRTWQHGENCGSHKLTWEAVREIRSGRIQRDPFLRLVYAKQFGVTRTTIYDVLIGRTWPEHIYDGQGGRR